MKKSAKGIGLAIIGEVNTSAQTAAIGYFVRTGGLKIRQSLQ